MSRVKIEWKMVISVSAKKLRVTAKLINEKSTLARLQPLIFTILCVGVWMILLSGCLWSNTKSLQGQLDQNFLAENLECLKQIVNSVLYDFLL